MKDLPLLFTDAMMRANVEGRKRATRRLRGLDVVNAEPDKWHLWQPAVSEMTGDWAWSTNAQQGEKGEILRIRCPYGIAAPGRKMWAREAFVLESNYNIEDEAHYPPPFSDGRPVRRVVDHPVDGDYWEQPHYRATDPEPELAMEGLDGPGVRWTPNLHMPRWACRFERPLVRIHCERLQDITEADAIAEGVSNDLGITWQSGDDTPIGMYGELWDSINGESGYGWDANPYVWVIEYQNPVTK